MEQRVQVGVGVLIFKNNSLLLGERLGSHGQHTWAAPGGHLEFGENVATCAIREVREETGLILTEIYHAPWTNDLFLKTEKHYLTVFVRAKAPIDQSPALLEPEKCNGWQWVATEMLPSPLFRPLNNLISLSKNLLSELADFSKAQPIEM